MLQFFCVHFQIDLTLWRAFIKDHLEALQRGEKLLKNGLPFFLAKIFRVSEDTGVK